MPIQHDYDYEQRTGECSYCGRALEVHEQGGFLDCPDCEEYDQEEQLEHLFGDDEEGGDFIEYRSFDEELDSRLWDDDDSLNEMCHEWGITPQDFWEIVHRRRADKLPAMTEAEAVDEALTDESEFSCSRCPHGMCPGGCEIQRNAYWNNLF